MVRSNGNCIRESLVTAVLGGVYAAIGVRALQADPGLVAALPQEFEVRNNSTGSGAPEVEAAFVEMITAGTPETSNK